MDGFGGEKNPQKSPTVGLQILCQILSEGNALKSVLAPAANENDTGLFTERKNTITSSAESFSHCLK